MLLASTTARCPSFVSAKMPIIAPVGAACPDHLVHTKRTPLLIDWESVDWRCRCG